MTHIPPAEPPACSRCGGELAICYDIGAAAPHDTGGHPAHLELCAACDAHKPAAGALLRFIADNGPHASPTSQGAGLLHQWMIEAMAERGWMVHRPLPGQQTASGEVAGRPGLLPRRRGHSAAELLQQRRDALLADLATADPDQRPRLQGELRELGAALAAAAAAETGALHDRVGFPRPKPGPLSPEAEQRVLDYFDELQRQQQQEEQGDEGPA